MGRLVKRKRTEGEREVGVTKGGSSTVNTGPALTAVPCAGTPSNGVQGKFAGLPLSSCVKLSLALLGKDLTGYIRSLEHRQLLVPLLRILVCGDSVLHGRAEELGQRPRGSQRRKY